MSLLAALGSVAAQAIGPLISTAGQLYANHENLKNQDHWNQVAVDLANSAHQREVKDLEAAGLNPILSSGGAGASTPALRAATVSNPTSAFGSSARTLGDALTGRIAAENERAEAEAASARAYAAMAPELVSAELSAQQRRNDLLSMEVNRGVWDSSNEILDSGARYEALTGKRTDDVDSMIDWTDKKAVDTYKNLVQQYRNQIEQGRYNASVGRSIFNDVLRGTESAAGVYRDLRGRGPSSSRTVNNNNYIMGGIQP